VTLVIGDDDLLVGRELERVVDLVRAAEPEADLSEVAAVDVTPDEFAALVSPSLFGDRRVVVVRGVQDAGKDLAAALLAYAGEPSPDVVLVAVHAGGAKGRSLIDALRRAAAHVVEVPKIRTARDREEFVVAEAERSGTGITREAATELIATVGTDLRQLAIACAQLASDVGGRIEVHHVALHARGRAEATGFLVADRAVDGDVAGALEQLRWAFAVGLDPVLVSSALAGNLRTIALVGAAGRGTPDSLAGALGMPAWKIRKAQAWVRGWHPNALAQALTAVADADAAVKGAAGDPEYAVERAVLAVAAARGER
jgi:DNA polymerase-3 subunit delta